MVDATVAPRDPLFGLRIHSFVLIKRFATGGMGVVCSPSITESLHIKCVVRLLPQSARDPAAFVREAETAAKLQHENIIEISCVSYSS